MPDFEALTREELIVLARQLYEIAAKVPELMARIAALEDELAKLRKGSPPGAARPVPSFVRSNVAPKEKKPRKKRTRSHVRLKEQATRTVDHAIADCPVCGHKLSGGWVHRVRQIIEIPKAAYEVIDHRMLRRHCGVCCKDHVARPDLSSDVVGRHRVGIRLMSLIVTLKKACRMTVTSIQRMLQSLYGLDLSRGEITEVLHAVADRGSDLYDQLQEEVRGSAYVHVDETSWRESGRNHWLWSFSTPNVRLFVEDPSRGHLVPKRVLGEKYNGILCSDFYAGYFYHLGLHQRCWVHYLRDIEELEQAHPADGAVAAWVSAVRAIYRRARDYISRDRKARVKARETFQEELLHLAKHGLEPTSPCRTLAQRIERFAQEMFTFVEHPDVPSDNNAAERAIRPSVIYRKMAGGTRSPRGSTTFAILMSLVATWQSRGHDPFLACQQMLADA